MSQKNRGIRLADNLWGRVQLEAERRGVSANRLVSDLLWEGLEHYPFKCFHCGAPAVHRGTVQVTDAYKPGTDIISMIAEHGDLTERDYSPVEVVYYVCGAHDDAAVDYFLDRDLQPAGRGLVREPDCPDPFHKGDGFSGGERMPDDYIGGGWAATDIYRCPTCKFQSFTRRQRVEDPAITEQFVTEFRRLVSDPH